MRLPQMKSLVNTAIGIAGVGITGMMYLQVKQLEEVSNSPFFKEAFKILRSHQGAISHLGEPIKQLGYRLGDTTNFVNTQEAQFKINVKGPNDKGKMHLWAIVKDGEWGITRIELELNKHPDKRLLIKGEHASQQPEQQQEQQQQQTA